MRRKITETLLKWKQSGMDECALLIDGARRVGKSFIVEEFAKAEFPGYLVINFKYVGNDVRETFDEYLSRMDAFFQRLFLVLGVAPPPRGSLIVFDEVQAFPRAREAIKPLVADGRYHYVETGSLLSIRKNTDGILVPSEERHVKMHPMDFEEFLWADGADGLMDVIREAFARRKSLGPLHRRAMDELRAYMLVGGMPQAVAKYVSDRDLAAVDRTKRDILELYRGDVSKHAGAQAPKVQAMWDAIPAQLSRHEKRYNLADLGENARMREYEDPAFWLKDSMTCNFCYNATEPNLGLALSADHATFKCYLADTGLLVSHAFDESGLGADPPPPPDGRSVHQRGDARGERRGADARRLGPQALLLLADLPDRPQGAHRDRLPDRQVQAGPQEQREPDRGEERKAPPPRLAGQVPAEVPRLPRRTVPLPRRRRPDDGLRPHVPPALHGRRALSLPPALARNAVDSTRRTTAELVLPQ